jgi:hypothetical protein
MRPFIRFASAAAVVSLTLLSAGAIEPKYLPPNAETAITLNLKQIQDSQLFQDKKTIIDFAKGFLQGQLESSPIKAYLDKAEFDLFRDLHSITITTDGSKDLDSMFIAIEGKFKTDKWVQVAKDAANENGEKLRVTKSGNTQIFELTPAQNEKTIYAGLINDKVLVAAPTRASLDATIARVTGLRSPGVKPAFKKLLDTTNSKQSFSYVASGKGIAKGLANMPRVPGGDIGASLESLDGLAFSITIAKDIDFQLAATAKDEDSAKQMAALANKGLTLGRTLLNNKKDNNKLEPLSDIVSTLKVTTQTSNVILRGVVTQETLDKILSFVPQ